MKIKYDYSISKIAKHGIIKNESLKLLEKYSTKKKEHPKNSSFISSIENISSNEDFIFEQAEFEIREIKFSAKIDTIFSGEAHRDRVKIYDASYTSRWYAVPLNTAAKKLQKSKNNWLSCFLNGEVCQFNRSEYDAKTQIQYALRCDRDEIEGHWNGDSYNKYYITEVRNESYKVIKVCTIKWPYWDIILKQFNQSIGNISNDFLHLNTVNNVDEVTASVNGDFSYSINYQLPRDKAIKKMRKLIIILSIIIAFVGLIAFLILK